MLNLRGVLDRPQLVQSVQVATISELRAADPAQWLDLEIMALVLGEDVADDGGGAIFYWSPQSQKADDGYYSIKPNNRLGEGRWLRHIIDDNDGGRFLVDDYGAVGNGIDDDTIAITNAKNDAAAAGGRLVFNPKRYRITSGLVYTDIDCFIDWNNATIVRDGNTHVVNVIHNYTEVQTITGITTASLNFGSGSNVTVLRGTVTDGSKYPAGTYCKIISDDLLTGPDPANEERWGEHFKVGVRTGNQIDMTTSLREPVPGFAPTGTIKIGKMRSDLKCRMIGVLNVEDGPLVSANPTWAKAAVLTQGTFKEYIEEVRCSSCSAQLVERRSNYMPYLGRVVANKLRTDPAYDAYGYGVIDNSCDNPVVLYIDADDVRHAYTTGCRIGQAGDDDFFDRGRTINFTVFGGKAKNCQAAPWDSHADCYLGRFIGCSGNAAIGNNSIGNIATFTLRGIGVEIHAASAAEMDGIQFNTDYASPWNSRDHKVYNYGYTTQNSTVSSLRQPIILMGEDATNKVSGVRIYNPTFDIRTGSSPCIMAKNAECTVFSPSFIISSSTANGRLVRAEDNSSIRLIGGFADMTGLTGANFDLCTATTDTSSIIWENATLTGMANVRAFANFNNVNSTIRFRNVITDTFCTDADGAVSTGGSSEVYELTFRDGNKRIIDEVSTTYTANSDITTLILASANTAPTTSDGTEVLSATITPKRTSSTIKCSVSLFGGVSAAGTITAALFRGSTLVEARPVYISAANLLGSINFVVEDSPASTIAQTYSVRVGSDDGAGVALTMRLNGTHAARRYGTNVKATLLLEEIGL